MKNKKYKFIIVTPPNNSGGAIVLHLLAKILKDLGEDSRVFYIYDTFGENKSRTKYWINWFFRNITEPFLDVLSMILKKTKYRDTGFCKHKSFCSVRGNRVQYLPYFNKDNTIVIYPEWSYGNILKAKNVVRYILSERIIGGIDDKELLYIWLKTKLDYNFAREIKELYLVYFNSELYKQTNFGKRNGYCYILWKGSNREDLPKEFKGPIIDGYSEKDKVKALNKYKYCYIYDSATFYREIAAVCGCIPIIVKNPDPNVGVKDDGYNYGIAQSDIQEEIDRAINTRELLRKMLLEENKKSIDKVKKFVEDCYSYFNNNTEL